MKLKCKDKVRIKSTKEEGIVCDFHDYFGVLIKLKCDTTIWLCEEDLEKVKETK